jgi:hypothetical protein
VKFPCDKDENQFILQDGDKDRQHAGNLSICDKTMKKGSTIWGKSPILKHL